MVGGGRGAGAVLLLLLVEEGGVGGCFRRSENPSNGRYQIQL